MEFDILVGNYQVKAVEKVAIKTSVETLCDTAVITIPSMVGGEPLDVSGKIGRGMAVCIKLGYKETNIVKEFGGWVQRVGIDGGNITIECEDDLFTFRKPMENKVYKNITLDDLLKKVVAAADPSGNTTVKCTYSWKYEKFTVNNADARDVLMKVQKECGADIYLAGGALHVHAPGERVGEERQYDFTRNIEKSDLKYMTAADKKVEVTVKSTTPDGKVSEIKVGSTGGEKVEVLCPTSDMGSMKRRGESELLRRSFDGYDGSIETWLVPVCRAGDSVTLKDPDYKDRKGTYFVTSVETTFDSNGGKRKIDLGFKLS